jgi:hypothetical protein
MKLYTIAVDANIASKEIERLKYQTLDGKPLAIRKKPHAIDVVFVENMALSCWCIT